MSPPTATSYRSRPLSLVLIDDSASDRFLTRDALVAINLGSLLTMHQGGEEGLHHLRQLVKNHEALPDLILLDLHMPRLSGREVLKIIKEDPDLCGIPVAMISSEGGDEEISACYRLKANCFVRKPSDFQQFADKIASLGRFWNEVASIPRLAIP